MIDFPDRGALVAHSYALARGPRVRLRLAQRRDLGAIRDLLRAHGDGRTELELERLVQSNPRERVAVCATALVDLRETIVGFGVIDVGSSEPRAVVVDRTRTDGLPALITEALVSRSAAIAERRAA